MRDIPHSPVAPYEVAHLFGTLIAETSLASVHVRARKQAGHMGASDLIKVLQNLARRGPSTYGECRFNPVFVNHTFRVLPHSLCFLLNFAYRCLCPSDGTADPFSKQSKLLRSS